MIKKLKSVWKDLNTTIYVGQRRKANLTALTVVSLFCTVLGAVLVVLDLVTKQYSMLIPSALTLLSGALCAYIAGVRKNRDVAIIIPTAFCAIAFTYYAVTGAGEGTAILWSILLPIGLCYFVSVKYGILLSAYYAVVFMVLFYTPLQKIISAYYTHSFIVRFPLLYISVSVFTTIAMVQYHRSVLLENEYANRLSREVERQTRVATERADRLETLSEEMVQTLAHVIDVKDRYTNGHSFRVSMYAVALAEQLGWKGQELADLRMEALLHDIGKIGVPDQVLNKPGLVTAEEYRVLQTHTEKGAAILAESRDLLGAADTAHYHHERYDGTGYPTGLAGKQIPANARIVSIADACDAMHSDRPYRASFTRERIRRELVEGRGTQFDPDFLDAFLILFDEGKLEALDRAS